MNEALVIVAIILIIGEGILLRLNLRWMREDLDAIAIAVVGIKREMVVWRQAQGRKEDDE